MNIFPHILHSNLYQMVSYNIVSTYCRLGFANPNITYVELIQNNICKDTKQNNYKYVKTQKHVILLETINAYKQNLSTNQINSGSSQIVQLQQCTIIFDCNSLSRHNVKIILGQLFRTISLLWLPFARCYNQKVHVSNMFILKL